MNIPKDPVMLLSFINTQLRDHYSSLDALCDENGLNKETIEKTLAAIDYTYSRGKNQFI